ncbi:unnamed protein product [Vitrella brassicaformis CCMP3155]|uniref:Uncharacterized protein n=2 Tax=Vitrella brassicaformis TaxID=1169539 RepID=A0A0G4ETG4_VITBC|nr:unnamed protein product [Vitrella brassicaformis CCMP3155]|eukprot:CEM01734.1 unnamed protein product [Vitrella brassicaformis CCMP3155]
MATKTLGLRFVEETPQTSYHRGRTNLESVIEETGSPQSPTREAKEAEGTSRRSLKGVPNGSFRPSVARAVHRGSFEGLTGKELRSHLGIEAPQTDESDLQVGATKDGDQRWQTNASFLLIHPDNVDDYKAYLHEHKNVISESLKKHEDSGTNTSAAAFMQAYRRSLAATGSSGGPSDDLLQSTRRLFMGSSGSSFRRGASSMSVGTLGQSKSRLDISGPLGTSAGKKKVPMSLLGEGDGDAAVCPDNTSINRERFVQCLNECGLTTHVLEDGQEVIAVVPEKQERRSWREQQDFCRRLAAPVYPVPIIRRASSASPAPRPGPPPDSLVQSTSPQTAFDESAYDLQAPTSSPASSQAHLRRERPRYTAEEGVVPFYLALPHVPQRPATEEDQQVAPHSPVHPPNKLKPYTCLPFAPLDLFKKHEPSPDTALRPASQASHKRLSRVSTRPPSGTTTSIAGGFSRPVSAAQRPPLFDARAPSPQAGAQRGSSALPTVLAGVALRDEGKGRPASMVRLMPVSLMPVYSTEGYALSLQPPSGGEGWDVGPPAPPDPEEALRATLEEILWIALHLHRMDPPLPPHVRHLVRLTACGAGDFLLLQPRHVLRRVQDEVPELLALIRRPSTSSSPFFPPPRPSDDTNARSRRPQRGQDPVDRAINVRDLLLEVCSQVLRARSLQEGQRQVDGLEWVAHTLETTLKRLSMAYSHHLEQPVESSPPLPPHPEQDEYEDDFESRPTSPAHTAQAPPEARPARRKKKRSFHRLTSPGGWRPVGGQSSGSKERSWQTGWGMRETPPWGRRRESEDWKGEDDYSEGYLRFKSAPKRMMPKREKGELPSLTTIGFWKSEDVRKLCDQYDT